MSIVAAALFVFHVGVLTVRIGSVPKPQLRPRDSARRHRLCANLSVPTCSGGFADIAAALRHGASEADGVVRIGCFTQVDPLIQEHPASLQLNDRLWSRVGVDALYVSSPFFLTWLERSRTVHHMSQQRHSLLATNLLLNEGNVFTHSLTPYHIAEPIPGIRVGILVLFPQDYWVGTAKFHQSVADFTSLLRFLGASVVVALVNGWLGDADVPVLQRTGVDVASYLSVTHTGPPVASNLGGMHIITKALHGIRPLVDWTTLHFSDSHELVGVSCNATAQDGIQDSWKDDAYDTDTAFLQGLVDDVERVDEVIGVCTVSIDNSPAWRKCRQQECEFGIITNDALLASRPGKVEIALSNGGAMRRGWSAGQIKKSHLAEAFPFQNEICYLNLTGAEIYRALEHSCSTLLPNGSVNTGGLTGQFLQAAGLRYTINPALIPYHRVTAIDLPGADGVWQPMDFKRVYSVATTNFLCGGGDGYAMNPHNGVMEMSATDLMAVMLRFFRDTSPVTPSVRGNILFNPAAPAMSVVKGAGLCSSTQLYLREWEICEECPLGRYAEGGVCLLLPAEEENTGLIAGVAVAAVVVLATAFPAYLVYSRRKRAQRVRHAPCNPDTPITIVFTDIKCSTELWAAYPAEMTIALQQHHRICRELIEEHCGYEVKTIGDAFMVAFGCPINAMAFMLELQLSLLRAEWPAGLLEHPACRKEGRLFNGLRVRAGAHHGYANIVETPAGGYDYDGSTCNLASRVGDCGDGGQVVVTECLYSAVEPHLDLLMCVPEARFLGSYGFKGVSEQVPCYQVLPDCLSGRLFDNLRNVHVPPGAPDAKPEAGLTVNTLRKGRLTRAMQVLRRWVARDTRGVTASLLRDLLMSAAQEDPTLNAAVTGAILATLSRRATDGAADGRPTLLVSEEASAPSESPSRSRTNSQSVHSLAAMCNTLWLRWPVVAEILRSLPPDFVLSLEAHLASAELGAVSGSLGALGAVSKESDADNEYEDPDPVIPYD